MRTLIRLFYGGMILLICSCASTKEFTTNSGRAVKHYETANELIDQRAYKKAVSHLRKAIDIDSGFVEAYLVLGDLNSSMKRPEYAVKAYRQAIQIDPDFYPNMYFHVAREELNMGKYKDGVEHLETFLSRDDINQRMRRKGKAKLKHARFALQLYQDSVPFNPKNLGDSINSVYDEYWPVLTADEEKMVFTRLLPVDTSDTTKFHNRQEDFFEATRKNDTTWYEAKNAGPPLNTFDNEGAHTLSVDGSYMFFTGCNRKDGLGMCDIYYSRKKDGQWTSPQNMGRPVNTKYSEKQPSVGSDGRTLYFASSRNGSRGRKDIWKSTLTARGTWSKPVNLGEKVNTQGDDTSPFIHPDGKTLYFSSTGHMGMGGYDIFVARKDSNGKWKKPENLGYPINTRYNEEGLFVNAKGNRAYYSSTRNRSRGKDIYRFELYDSVRPQPVSYLKGRVYDAETNSSLSAHFELLNLDNGKLIMASQSSPEDGEFLITLPVGGNYALNVSKKGYLFYSDHFQLQQDRESTAPIRKDIPLQPLKKGQKIVLENIFYEVDSFALKEASRVELNKVIEFLDNNPQVKIGIYGHTDSTAGKAYNQRLSRKRAREVVRYLKQNGIAEKRLSYKGFGESQPIADNATPEGRAKNRRTEMVIKGTMK